MLLFLEPCDFEIWRMTSKNYTAPLLNIIKLYASFHHHMCIQSGVIVRKPFSWVLTSVTFTFDLDLLHGRRFCHWSYLLKISWWYNDGKKAVKKVWEVDKQTDRRTEKTIHRAAWSQLKMSNFSIPIGSWTRLCQERCLCKGISCLIEFLPMLLASCTQCRSTLESEESSVYVDYIEMPYIFTNVNRHRHCKITDNSTTTYLGKHK